MTGQQASTFQDLRERWMDFVSQPPGKYLVLLPAALTALASMEGLGRIARALTSLWQPFLDLLQKWLAPILPENLSPFVVVMCLFWAPFAISGILQVFSREGPKPTPIAIGAIAPIAYLLVATAAFGSKYLGPGAYIAYSIPGFVLSAVYLSVRLKTRNERIALLSLPVVVAVLVTIIELFVSFGSPTVFERFLRFLTLLGLASPLLNPRRIVDVAVILLVLLALSFAGHLVENLIALGT